MPIISEERIRQFINHCIYKKGLAARTTYEYDNELQDALTYFHLSTFGTLSGTRQEVMISDLQAFIRYYEEDRKLSAAAIQRKLIILNIYMQYCEKRFNEPIIECIYHAKKPVISYSYLKQAHRATLIDGLDKNKFFYRNKIIILLLLQGIKVNELTALNYSKLVESQIILPSREITLTASLRGAIRDYINNERGRNPGALFLSKKGTRLTARSIERMLKQADACSGLFKNITPEKLRQTYIVEQFQKGVPIRELQQQLGLKEPLKLANIEYL